ncbi:hypothetical protein GPX89_03905 [Nocardia sp. ET3-3]|uniref:Uncharacterized protein n=1 Tax=Nocardia terrae TaxID=2675851 RepID=A0A7K1UQ06_9NOCA|nr:DUF6153 family protein [Nocardia terrae]MVU76387.1 hypothetical protein [Nocardia terrae]
MADQRVSRRATGVVRWLGVLALLLGIAAMHAGVFSVATGAGHDMAGPATAIAAPMAAMHDAPSPADQPAPTHVQHACEAFTLAAAAFVLGLIVLGWITRTPDSDHPAAAPTAGDHRERPPPWTVPALAQLSILRI